MLRERAGPGVVRVDDQRVARPLPADDRLLGSAVGVEGAVQLEVVRPEAGDRRDRGALLHEGEVGRRQLEHERAVEVGPVEQLGGRPQVAEAPGGARVRCGVSGVFGACGAKELDGGARGGRLPRGAGDADREALRPVEEEVADARHARAACEEVPHPRCHLRRPDIQVGDLGKPRVRVQIGVGLDQDAEPVGEGKRLGRSGACAGEADRLPRGRGLGCGLAGGEVGGERYLIGLEALDEDGHTPIMAAARPGCGRGSAALDPVETGGASRT